MCQISSSQNSPTVIIKERTHFSSPQRLRSWFVYFLLFLQSLTLTISPTGAFVQESLNSSTILERTLRSTIDYNKVLKVDSYYLNIVDENPALSQRGLFASIRENGSLELSHKSNDKIKIRTIDAEQLLLLISDKSRIWYLCLDGNGASTKNINIKENTPEECVWKLNFESWRLRPIKHSNKPIQFGLYTRNFHNIVLYLKGDVKGMNSRTSQDCLNVKRRLTRLAFDELKSANKTLHQIQLIRQKIRVATEGQSAAIVKLIDELIQIHFKLEMLRWDREGLSVTDKKEFIGFSGTHYKVPYDDRNRSALFTSIVDHEMRLKHGEKWVVRNIFGRTLKVYVWNGSFKRAYMKKQSFSNILRGLNLLSEEESDIERQLYLINRYLPRGFTSESIPPLEKTTSGLQDRAVLLKLEEIILRRNDSYFVRKLSCLEDMIRNLPNTAN